LRFIALEQLESFPRRSQTTAELGAWQPRPTYRTLARRSWALPQGPRRPNLSHCHSPHRHSRISGFCTLGGTYQPSANQPFLRPARSIIAGGNGYL
jgi:hypothetical protein